jgi:hypothetical protein
MKTYGGFLRRNAYTILERKFYGRRLYIRHDPEPFKLMNLHRHNLGGVRTKAQ